MSVVPVINANAQFPATSWSTISAARGADDPRAAEGLRILAANYWQPLYVYLRRCDETHEDAADLVQGFFGVICSSEFLTYVNREDGKFRSYLLKSLDRWRSRCRVRNGAQKRGGGVQVLSLEAMEEFKYQVSHDDGRTAIEAFDRQWAISLLGVAVEAVRQDYIKRGRERWFDVLRAGLPGGAKLPPYVELAEKLGASPGAVKKAVFDLRSAFASRLRDEIRATVQSRAEAEDELRYLLSIMSP